MNRPTITREMILEAAKKVASRIPEMSAEEIADHYSYPMDGYQLAREIDSYGDLTMDDVEELDSMDYAVHRLLDAAEKKWVEETKPQPPFPVGTTIKQGVIDGICEHSPARYKVKEPGCTQAGRWLLIKFEDAIAA